MIAATIVHGHLYRVNGLILIEAKSKHGAMLKVLRAMFGNRRSA